MSSNQNLPIDNTNFYEAEKYEVDIKKVFDALKRNKKIIGLFSLSGLILSVLFAFSIKKTWQGEFQIVLGNVNAPSSLDRLKNTAFARSSTNQLDTEIEILKSPLVLMKVFEFVKSEKKIPKDNLFDYVEFKSWRENLSISLEKGTTILNLTYKDTNKDVILPALSKISSIYQEYSGMKRLRDIELGVNYYKDQISIYKDKSIKSSRQAQQFAIDQDLSVLGNQSENDVDIQNTLNLEIARISAANEIRLIDEKLELINNLGTVGYEQILYISSTIDTLGVLTERLKSIDNNLSELRLIYMENDKNIQDLIKSKKQLISILTRQAKGFLLAQKADAQTRFKSAERPKGVLVKYRELQRNAEKNRKTVDTLENQYRNLLLEKARSEDPWKLITKPQLIPYPVAPRKKRIVAFGLFAGMFLGSGFSLIVNKRKNIIFSIDEMELSTKSPLLAELPITQKQKWNESFDLIKSVILTDIEGSLAFLMVGDLDQSILSQLDQSVRSAIKDRQLIITSSLIEATKFSNLVVISALGLTSSQQFREMNKNLLLQKKPVLGLIVIT